MKRKLHIISHTHWDREWYQTFQAYRKRLVAFMDELIEVMEKTPAFEYFHLDGQTIVLEDYLKIRPEMEGRLRKLIQDGRILIGPWYVMPDEFLVSGESLVRNLLMGHLICQEYGVEPMKNGYVTDIFGHNSQFPQILQGFGIDSATLYRGIGDYPKSEFTWEGADGSRVLALKLDEERSYSNFYFAIRWPFDNREYEAEEVKDRMNKLLEFMGPKATTRHYLMMDGVDHTEMEPQLPLLMEMLGKLENVEIVHTTLDQYVKELKNDVPELEIVKGELRTPAYRGINNQLLNDVLSSMVQLKQANDECESLLTGWVEPFSTIRELAGLGEYQKGFLKEAWRYLLMNQPHDSICGCSITPVHQDNEYRFRQVYDIAGELMEENLRSIVKSVDTSGFTGGYSVTVFHNGQEAYQGVALVEVLLPGKFEHPGGLKRAANIHLYDGEGNAVPYQVVHLEKNRMKLSRPYRMLPRFDMYDVYTLAVNVSIPAMGYTTLNYDVKELQWPGEGDYTFQAFYPTVRYPGSMQTDYNTWDNGELRVTVNGNGSLYIDDVKTGRKYRDLLLFEDGGDTGDGWNFRKPLHDTVVSSIANSAQLSVESEGPLFARLRIDTQLQLPRAARQDDYARSEEEEVFRIKTYIDIRKGSRRIEFTSHIDNNVRDHRLRVLFPTGIATDGFHTSTPFDVYERKIKRPDYDNHIEPDTKVSPNQGLTFVRDAGAVFALFNKGLYEVEAKDDRSRTLALTLFRSFSKEVGRNEGELGKLQRPLKFEYALYLGTGEETAGELMVMAKAFREGTRSLCDLLHKGTLPLQQSYLQLAIPGAVISCLKKSEDGKFVVVRLYNCENTESSGHIRFNRPIAEACRLDMKEDRMHGYEVDDSLSLHMNPKEVVTLGLVFEE